MRVGAGFRPGLLFVLGVTSIACIEPGQAPVFADAAAVQDAIVEDARPPIDTGPRAMDSGAADAISVLADAAPAPWFPFSGVFRIVGAGVLFAREVDQHLSLIVDVFPNVYTGTITRDGRVMLTGDVLARSGCPTAAIRGTYIRDQAFHTLELSTCNAQGATVTAPIQGGFDRDYEPTVSGVYELTATLAMDLDGCYRGPRSQTVRYGLSFDPASGSVAVFTTADDVIDAPAMYIGTYDRGTFALSALSRPFASASNFDVSMRGRFEQPDPLQPPRFIGQRDVLDVRRQCGFSITLDGPRIERP